MSGPGTDGEVRRQRVMDQIRRLGWPPYFVVAITLTVAVICIALVATKAVQDVPAIILLATGLGAGVISLMALVVLTYQVRASTRDPEDAQRQGIFDYLVLGGLPFLVLVGGVITYWLISPRTDSALPAQLSTTFFLAFSVIALLLSLSMTAIFYSWVKLSDARQPLGLPEGSVRAVIALALIIIFAITAIFLYTQVSTSTVLTTTGLTAEEVALIPADQRLETRAEPAPTPAPGATPLPDGETPAPVVQTYTVTRIDPAQRNGNELAQQIVTTVSTLVVAVSAFYFGSSSVRSATDALAAAAGTAGLKVAAPRQRSRLRKEGDKYAIVDIAVESTPPNQAITGEILSGDTDGRVAQTEPGSFAYAPKTPGEKVLIQFALIGDPSTNATLVLLRPDGTDTTAPASQSATQDDGDDDVRDGKPDTDPPSGGPPAGPGGNRDAARRTGKRRGELVGVADELPDALRRDAAAVPPDNPPDGETDDEPPEAEEAEAAEEPDEEEPVAEAAPKPDAMPVDVAQAQAVTSPDEGDALDRILDERGGRRRRKGGFFSTE